MTAFHGQVTANNNKYEQYHKFLAWELHSPFIVLFNPFSNSGLCLADLSVLLVTCQPQMPVYMPSCHFFLPLQQFSRQLRVFPASCGVCGDLTWTVWRDARENMTRPVWPLEALPRSLRFMHPFLSPTSVASCPLYLYQPWGVGKGMAQERLIT